jgi:transcriptional regulator with XRE-family HTH domain
MKWLLNMPVFKGELLRARRESRGITREELSARTHRAYGTLVKLEKDEIRPSSTTLGLLAEALGCSVGDFYGQGDQDDRASDLGPGIDAWIAKTLAEAPPMSPEVARRVSDALFGGAA